MLDAKRTFIAAVGQILDPYSRQARLAPALIVIFPVALLLAVWFPVQWAVWGALLTVATSCGLILFLSQIARDRGKLREPELYDSWGGKPSVALLRHRDSRIDPYTKARYRTFLMRQVSGLTLPTESEEEGAPHLADEAYQSATAWLLSQTRDTIKFPILFRENVSFGFRRNLWGLKAIGSAVSFLAALASTTLALYLLVSHQVTPTVEVVIATIIAWFLFLIWLTTVTPSWIKIPADAFGMQLLAACDTLAAQANPPKAKKALVR